MFLKGIPMMKRAVFAAVCLAAAFVATFAAAQGVEPSVIIQQPVIPYVGGSPVSPTNPMPSIAAPPAAARHFPGCTVGSSSGSCLAASTAVNFLQIQNTSASASIACAFGVAAVLNSLSSVLLAPGQPASWGPNTGGVPSGQLNCIASAGSTPLYVEWN